MYNGLKNTKISDAIGDGGGGVVSGWGCSAVEGGEREGSLWCLFYVLVLLGY